MSDFHVIVDRVEIEALRGEFSDAAMMRDRARLASLFTEPAPAERLERVAAALRANNFDVEILDDAAAARARVKELIPAGASVFTGASETLRLSGIDEDINGRGTVLLLREAIGF